MKARRVPALRLYPEVVGLVRLRFPNQVFLPLEAPFRSSFVFETASQLHSIIPVQSNREISNDINSYRTLTA